MEKDYKFRENEEQATELISEEGYSTQEKRAISENGATLSVGANNFVGGVGSGAIGYGNFAQRGQAVNVLHTDFATRTLTLEEAIDFQVGETVILVPSSFEYESSEAVVESWDAATKSLVLNQVGSGASYLVKPAQASSNSEAVLAVGYKNIACGEYGSYAEGRGTTAAGATAHAEGGVTSAFGDFSHAEGYYSKTEGNNSHAEGALTNASGLNSHAEGAGTTASGMNAHAEGSYSNAEGEASHAEGNGTSAVGKAQHVEGEYNLLDTAENASERGTYAHIVGNGTSEKARSNAHTLDWDGNAWFAGDVTVGADNVPLAKAKDAEFNGSFDVTDGPVTIGTRADLYVPEGIQGLTVGEENLADTRGSIAAGKRAYAVKGYCYKILAIDGKVVTVDRTDNSLGGSQKLIAFRMKGSQATREVELISCDTDNHITLNTELPTIFSNGGYLLHMDEPDTLKRTTSFAFGERVVASGDGALASGNRSIAEGNQSTATGFETRAVEAGAHAEGYNVEARGIASHAEGTGTVAVGIAQHVEGEFNVIDTAKYASYRGEYVHIVGNGTSEEARSNAHTLDWDGNAWFAGDVESATAGKLSEKADANHLHDEYAPIASPNFTGAPKAPTPDMNDNSTRIATTAYVQALVQSLASIPQIGDVKAFAKGEKVPEGWLPCDGKLYQKTTYPQLFEALNYQSETTSKRILRSSELSATGKTFQPLLCSGLGRKVLLAGANSASDTPIWIRVDDADNAWCEVTPPGDARWACYNNEIKKFLLYGTDGHVYISGPFMQTWENANAGFPGGKTGLRCANATAYDDASFFWSYGGADGGYMSAISRNYNAYPSTDALAGVDRTVTTDIMCYGTIPGYRVPGRIAHLYQLYSYGQAPVAAPHTVSAASGYIVDLAEPKASSDSNIYWIDDRGEYGSYREGDNSAKLGTLEASSSDARICAVNAPGLLLGSGGKTLWYMDNGTEKQLAAFAEPIQTICAENSSVWLATTKEVYRLALQYTTNYFAVPLFADGELKHYIKAE